VALYR